jgi:mRNA interferase MazF
MARQAPARGEVWDADLNPPRGHEQGGTRPTLVVSVDLFNQGASGLVIVIPISSKDKRVRSQVAIDPPDGGQDVRSFAKCEAVRSISVDRLIRRRGTLPPTVLSEVELRLRFLLGL